MLLSVAEDVTDGGEGTSVATGWLEVSLGAPPGVVGCGGGTLMLGAGWLALSVGVALGLLKAGEEGPSRWLARCWSGRESRWWRREHRVCC